MRLFTFAFDEVEVVTDDDDDDDDDDDVVSAVCLVLLKISFRSLNERGRMVGGNRSDIVWFWFVEIASWVLVLLFPLDDDSFVNISEDDGCAFGAIGAVAFLGVNGGLALVEFEFCIDVFEDDDDDDSIWFDGFSKLI